MVKKKNKRSKNKRKKDKRKQNIVNNPHFGGLSWMDKEGLHAILPGEAPSEEVFKLWTENFQKQLRNSPLWDEMVAKFGEEKAEKLLKQCQVELRKS